MPISKLKSIVKRRHKNSLKEIAKSNPDPTNKKNTYYPIRCNSRFVNFDKEGGICKLYPDYKKVDMLELDSNKIILTEFKTGKNIPIEDLISKLLDSVIILSNMTNYNYKKVVKKIIFRIVYKSSTDSYNQNVGNACNRRGDTTPMEFADRFERLERYKNILCYGYEEFYFERYIDEYLIKEKGLTATYSEKVPKP